MNVLLWIFQIGLAFLFLFSSFAHFTQPPGLPLIFAWIYDLPAGLHIFSGTVEVLGALGLVLPGLFKTRTVLTPLAAAGLALTMIGAVVWHIPRGEYANIGMNVVLAGILAFIAYMRWTRYRLPEREEF